MPSFNLTHTHSFKKTILLYVGFLPLVIRTVIYTHDARPFGVL